MNLVLVKISVQSRKGEDERSGKADKKIHSDKKENTAKSLHNNSLLLKFSFQGNI